MYLLIYSNFSAAPATNQVLLLRTEVTVLNSIKYTLATEKSTHRWKIDTCKVRLKSDFAKKFWTMFEKAC